MPTVPVTVLWCFSMIQSRATIPIFAIRCIKGRSWSSSSPCDTPQAGFNLKSFSVDLADADVRRRWVYLFDRVVKGEMPPKSADRPDAASKSTFLRSLGDSLTRADLVDREVILRRLNRNEYENTVRDLFGIHAACPPKSVTSKDFSASRTHSLELIRRCSVRAVPIQPLHLNWDCSSALSRRFANKKRNRFGH